MTPQLPDTWAAASILNLSDTTGLDIQNTSSAIYDAYAGLLRLALDALEDGGLREKRHAMTAIRIALRLELP